jgi:Flp pilus assembly protein TadD
MSLPKKSTAAPALVVGIFVFILGIAATAWWFQRSSNDDSQFATHMNAGRGYHAAGDARRAIEAFQAALLMNPANPDVHLNLANAYLLASQPSQALVHAREALQVEPGRGGAHYLAGCAHLRLGAFSNAVQSLTEAKQADRTLNTVSFQLGLAYAGWGRFPDAAEQFVEVIEFDKDHPSAHYQLSQAYLRQGAREQAAAELAEHQRISAGKSQAADNPTLFEKCKYTEILAPFALEQPESDPVSVRFVEDTARALGPEAGQLRGPFGLFDLNRRGWNDVLLSDDKGSLRLLWNSNATFAARSEPWVSTVGTVQEIVVGDLNNDRYDDAIIVGSEGSQLLKFATNGFMTDGSALGGIRAVKATGATLGDIDVTGKLALLAVTPEGRLRAFTNFGTAIFRERKAAPRDGFDVTGVTSVTIEDWNNDDLPDVLLTRKGERPWILTNQRRDGLAAGAQPMDWPVARYLAVGDFNNDLRADVALVTDAAVALYFGGLKEPVRIPAKKNGIQTLRALDYDNDGWLDLVSWGTDGLRVWRNRGRRGFHEMTEALGLKPLASSVVNHASFADFDQDGDIDCLVESKGAGVRFFRNEGANANGLVKFRPIGNRSNFSGIGLRIELNAGNWRALRSVQRKPVEIGVGRHKDIETVIARWADTQPLFGVSAHPKQVVDLIEPKNPTGSCPYLYAWDGTRFRFLTDILSSAPVGLPSRPGHNIVADPREWVALGGTTEFVPKDGRYTVQLTEELREILYLDEAKLGWVDIEANAEAHSTSKLVPRQPFPRHELRILSGRIPLRAAQAGDGTDLTATLDREDGQRFSPRLRAPQLRGLAESTSVLLDFGPLAGSPELTLALSGWLRFGGGMANIAGSHDPELPFPFPQLEAETAPGQWQPLQNVVVGVPAGRTKTILVPLGGHLPPGTQRLRMTYAFELHWDRIALFQKNRSAEVGTLRPTSTDLHWHGYGEFAAMGPSDPLTPLHENVQQRPPWRITPSGWATRYGAVDPLIAAEDNGVVTVAAGDELTLSFAADALPKIPSGHQRRFFLWTVGWNKDADYHVAAGDRIEPLPWHGMDDARHGQEPRPAFASDALHQHFNTRWVGPLNYERVEAKRGEKKTGR